MNKLVADGPTPGEIHALILKRIEGLMDANAGTPTGEELHLLGDLAVFYERQLGWQSSSAPEQP